MLALKCDTKILFIKSPSIDVLLIILSIIFWGIKGNASSLLYISLGKEIYVYRDEKEHRRLLSSLTYFSNSINSDIIYPRQSIACNACPVKNFCDKYQF